MRARIVHTKVSIKSECFAFCQMNIISVALYDISILPPLRVDNDEQSYFTCAATISPDASVVSDITN